MALPDSYWVIDGRLLAGEYPGSATDDETGARLRALLALGVTHFVDLTESRELPPYASLLEQEAVRLDRQVSYQRFPVADFGVPTREVMCAILDALDAAFERQAVVYLHCHGGVGRTATVVGCHLVRGGLAGDEALARIQELRAASRKAHRPSPETEDQRSLIREWA